MNASNGTGNIPRLIFDIRGNCVIRRRNGTATFERLKVLERNKLFDDIAWGNMALYKYCQRKVGCFRVLSPLRRTRTVKSYASYLRTKVNVPGVSLLLVFI